MGLVLELYPDEPYNDFYVDDFRVKLIDVRHEFNFVLEVEQPALRTKHIITDNRATEILPGIRVSAGTGADIEKYGVKVVVEAPKRIRIDRGTVYRKKNGESAE